jgi:preprotein translocase subunit SecA
VVEYDDVVNRQREIFYKRRYKLIMAQDTKNGISDQIDDLLQKEIKKLVNIYATSGIDKNEANRIVQELQLILPLNSTSTKNLHQKIKNQDLQKVIQVLVEIIKKARSNQKEMLSNTLKQTEIQLSLATYDEAWMQHLDQLDSLREGIGLRGYAQKDPLVEYRSEAYNLFESLLARIDSRIAERIFRIAAAPPMSPQPAMVVEQSHQDINTPKTKTASRQISSTTKIGRNDPCWCGSGKKWKKCHYPELS